MVHIYAQVKCIVANDFKRYLGFTTIISQRLFACVVVHLLHAAYGVKLTIIYREQTRHRSIGTELCVYLGFARLILARALSVFSGTSRFH